MKNRLVSASRKGIFYHWTNPASPWG